VCVSSRQRHQWLVAASCSAELLAVTLAPGLKASRPTVVLNEGYRIELKYHLGLSLPLKQRVPQATSAQISSAVPAKR